MAARWPVRPPERPAPIAHVARAAASRYGLGVTTADRELITTISTVLAAGANADRAAGQQRYMNSSMPYRGLTSGELKAALRPVLADHRIETPDVWRATIKSLWDEAAFREERYAAIAVLRHRFYRAWARDPDPETIGLLRHLIISGAWWDLVDEVASHGVGDLLRSAPDEMTPVLLAWAHDPDLWLRRTAIISQLGSRDSTDTDLLTTAILGSIDDSDFFARKAIGWALRQYARTDPEWVIAFVRAHSDALSPLSRREALKHLQSREADS